MPRKLQLWQRMQQVTVLNKRYLIVNADDFGMCEPSDKAICALFDAGIITSTTVLAPASRAKWACETAAEKGYAAGVHWTLGSEWHDDLWRPCAPREHVPSLLNTDGYLYPDGKSIAKNAKGKDVTTELEAQYAFLARHGCIPDHADSHSGTLYGINGRLFFINAFRVCKKHQLPFRFAKSDGFLRRQFDGKLPHAIPLAQKGIVALAKRMGVTLLDDFITHPHPVARINGYNDLKAYYNQALATAPAGICEVFLHPSLHDDALLARTPEWQKRIWEYQYLSEGSFSDTVKREGFTLVSFSDIAKLSL